MTVYISVPTDDDDDDDKKEEWVEEKEKEEEDVEEENGDIEIDNADFNDTYLCCHLPPDKCKFVISKEPPAS